MKGTQRHPRRRSLHLPQLLGPQMGPAPRRFGEGYGTLFFDYVRLYGLEAFS